jgi:hypothetical protein
VAEVTVIFGGCSGVRHGRESEGEEQRPDQQ